MKLYYEVPTLTDRLENGPFHWSSSYGEGSTAGIRIDASGAGIYNVIRPRWPLPVNDDLTFSVQARVESFLTTDNIKQGFAIQVRAIKHDGAGNIVTVWTNDPDANSDDLWLSRQDPGFIYYTTICKIPANVGATHLIIEPMVHAASGYCNVTSVRMRSIYTEVIDIDVPGPQYFYSDLTNTSSNGYQVYSQSISLSKGQEVKVSCGLSVDADFEHRSRLVILFQDVNGNSVSYGFTSAFDVSTSLTASEESSDSSNIALTEHYSMTAIVYAASSDSVSGNFEVSDLKISIQKRDILRQGA